MVALMCSMVAVDSGLVGRQRRSPSPLHPALAIPAAVGSGWVLKRLITGDGSIPRLNVGVNGDIGLGPFRAGGKVGVGGGGVERGAWYEPLSVDQDVVVQGAGGVGLGETEYYGGAGAAADYQGPNIFSYLRSRLPSFPCRWNPFKSCSAVEQEVVVSSEDVGSEVIYGPSWIEPIAPVAHDLDSYGAPQASVADLDTAPLNVGGGLNTTKS